MAAVAAAVVGVTVSLWQAVRATHAERAARDNAAMAATERHQAVEARSAAERERERAERHRANAERNLYVANMCLAREAWEQNNVVRVRELLEETATYPERGFEWHYWQRQTHLDLKTLRGHSDHIHSAAFSPDGQRIVTGSEDNTAKVWEAASGQELLTLKGHRAAIESVAISPDGQRIATASWDRTARVLRFKPITQYSHLSTLSIPCHDSHSC